MKILNMKKITHCLKVCVTSAILLLSINDGIAQEQAIRSGSAGAAELLINPFSRTNLIDSSSSATQTFFDLDI